MNLSKLIWILVVLSISSLSFAHAEISPGVVIGLGNHTYTVSTAFNGSLNVTDSALYLNNSAQAKIDGSDYDLSSLASGNQTYSLDFNLTSSSESLLNCSLESQAANHSLNLNWTNLSCSGSFELPQASENTFYPVAETSLFRIQRSDFGEGVEIEELSTISSDTENYGNENTQYFLKDYNLTNNLAKNFTGIIFSPTADGQARSINISNSSTPQTKGGSYTTDLLSFYDWTLTGDEFNAEQAYTVYRNFDYNNTLSFDLPEAMIALSLNHYDSNAYAEKQDGLLWPDLNSSYNGSHILFNLTEINASENQTYRTNYDAEVVGWDGESIADYTLSGEYREWTLDRTYFFNFPATGKSIIHNITSTALTEWIGKTATWTSTLIENVTGASYPHTTTDRVSFAQLSFDDANSSAEYDYQLIYYTQSSISGGSTGGGGGGGGGGGSSSSDITEEEVEEIIERKTQKLGYIEFQYPGHVKQVPYLQSSDFYKEVVIRAVGGPVNATLAFSENLKPYFIGGICDLRSDQCYENILIKEDEEKYIFMQGNLSSEQFMQDLVEDDNVKGFVQVLSSGYSGPHQYNITLKKFPLFDSTLELADYEIDKHKWYYIAASLTIIAVMIALFSLVLPFIPR